MSSFLHSFLHTVLVLLLFFKVLVLDLVRVSGLVLRFFLVLVLVVVYYFLGLNSFCHFWLFVIQKKI